MISILENNFLLRPQAEAVYRSANRKYIPGLAQHITPALVDGSSRPGFQDHVQGKLRNARQWKDYPNLMIKIMTKPRRWMS